MNYANQYQISFKGVNKIVAPEKDEQFLIIKWDILEQAFKRLVNPSERFLYLYLLKFRGMEQTNQNLWLSPTDFEATFGVSLRAYKEARKSLENKGFLKKIGGKLFVFVPLPE